jgi:hypothetical protein
MAQADKSSWHKKPHCPVISAKRENTMRLALAGLALVAAVAGGTATAEAHDYRYYAARHPPRVRYVPPPRVYYAPPPPAYYYAPAPVYVVPRPVPYAYYPAYRPYAVPGVASFSFTYHGH